MDYDRAFDTVKLALVQIIKIERQLHQVVTIRVIYNGDCKRSINIRAGVSQGCIIFFFSIAID